MGFLDQIRTALGIDGRLHSSSALASPWVERPTHLEPIIVNDFLRDEFRLKAITREQAIRVPALSRARGLIVSTIARLPLVAVDDDGEETGDTPGFITDTTGPLSPFHRMLWTIDDLFFYGWSLWAVQRSGKNGPVTAADRIAFDRWHIDSEGTVMVDGSPAPADSVVLIPGVTEGILTYGADTLDQAMRLAAAATRAAENPVPQVELHQTNDAPMTREEIDAITARWMQARRGENGGVAFTSQGVQVIDHGDGIDGHLLIDGRNAAAVDIARHAGIPAPMIDATLAGSSLSYQNTASRMSELVTFGLSPLMAAVAARLSQDDVTPPGVTLAFDTTDTIQQLADLYRKTADLSPKENPDEQRL
ncbi:phage portal protein [Corynebacterium mastitidis]|uniref:Phage portal protein n=1 Tax=Corynebacterium mastitidis TaxID=161890 RepID=A0ABU8P109_9CORY